MHKAGGRRAHAVLPNASFRRAGTAAFVGFCNMPLFCCSQPRQGWIGTEQDSCHLRHLDPTLSLLIRTSRSDPRLDPAGRQALDGWPLLQLICNRHPDLGIDGRRWLHDRILVVVWVPVYHWGSPAGYHAAALVREVQGHPYAGNAVDFVVEGPGHRFQTPSALDVVGQRALVGHIEELSIGVWLYSFTLYRLAPFAQSLLCSCDLHYLKGRLQVAPELEAGGPRAEGHRHVLWVQELSDLLALRVVLISLDVVVSPGDAVLQHALDAHHIVLAPVRDQAADEVPLVDSITFDIPTFVPVPVGRRQRLPGFVHGQGSGLGVPGGRCDSGGGRVQQRSALDATHGAVGHEAPRRAHGLGARGQVIEEAATAGASWAELARIHGLRRLHHGQHGAKAQARSLGV
mmetsp:Transcript_126067/g.299347  ORF Transcript_126067/g.299347 Transcript_126067/m.299347 type:complete len:402 (+) Transcript_126067:123-1328(+)